MAFPPLALHFNPLGRRGGLLAALVAVACLTACRTLPVPRGFAEASASAAVEYAADSPAAAGKQAVHFNRFQTQEFEGYGAGKLPPDASGSFQARAVARAEARRAALRALAKQITEFRIDGAPTLPTLLGDDANWRATLERSLEQYAVVEYKTHEDEPIEMARARIRGDAIFHGPAAPGSVGQAREGADGEELDLIARRRRAEEQATRAARDFLYEDLLPFGATLGPFGTRREPSERYKQALRAEVDVLPPDSVEFTDDGQCIVILRYDREALERLDR